MFIFLQPFSKYMFWERLIFFGVHSSFILVAMTYESHYALSWVKDGSRRRLHWENSLGDLVFNASLREDRPKGILFVIVFYCCCINSSSIAGVTSPKHSTSSAIRFQILITQWEYISREHYKTILLTIIPLGDVLDFSKLESFAQNTKECNKISLQ